MKDPEGNETFVGLVVVAKSPLGGSMQPYRMSKARAQELAKYLAEAAR